MPVVRFCLALGAASAAVAAGLGWLLAESERASDELAIHRWTGVAVAALAALTFFLGERAAWDATPRGRRALRWSLALLVALVSVAGHYGGVLTYGDDWFPFP